MTFVELKDETFRQVREATGSGVYFSTDDIGAAVNAGYAELSDATEWCEEYVTIDLLKSRPYYDLFALIGCGFLSIKPGFHEDTNRWLIPSTVRALDGNDRRWERVVGTPQRVFLRGLRWLGLWPRTTADSGTLKQYYTRLPVPLCLDTDEPGFPEAYHIGCVHFALADLYAQDGETKRALGAWADYLAIEDSLMLWVNRKIARPHTPVLGGMA